MSHVKTVIFLTMIAVSNFSFADICLTNNTSIEKIRAYYTCDGSLFGCSKAQLVPQGIEMCWMASAGKMDLLRVPNNECGTMLLDVDAAKINVMNKGGKVVCEVTKAASKGVAESGTTEGEVEAAPNFVTVHYWREDPGGYDGWGLHLWGEGVVNPTNESEPKTFQDEDDYGAVLVFEVIENVQASQVRFYVHNGKDRDITHNREFTVESHKEFWLIQDDPAIYTEKSKADDAIKFIKEFMDF